MLQLEQLESREAPASLFPDFQSAFSFANAAITIQNYTQQFLAQQQPIVNFYGQLLQNLTPSLAASNPGALFSLQAKYLAIQQGVQEIQVIDQFFITGVQNLGSWSPDQFAAYGQAAQFLLSVVQSQVM